MGDRDRELHVLSKDDEFIDVLIPLTIAQFQALTRTAAIDGETTIAQVVRRYVDAGLAGEPGP
jgi:hypothetical protein